MRGNGTYDPVHLLGESGDASESANKNNARPAHGSAEELTLLTEHELTQPFTGAVVMARGPAADGL